MLGWLLRCPSGEGGLFGSPVTGSSKVVDADGVLLPAEICKAE